MGDALAEVAVEVPLHGVLGPSVFQAVEWLKFNHLNEVTGYCFVIPLG